MSKVVRVLASAFSLLALLVLSSSPAYAQGGTTSTLSGIAVDSSGAVLPGADVTVTLPSTGFTQSAVTNADGAFSFPGLNIGTYTVTVKLSGFKTFVSNNVVLTSGAGANVKRDARGRRRSRNRSSCRRRRKSSRRSRRPSRRRSTRTRFSSCR